MARVPIAGEGLKVRPIFERNLVLVDQFAISVSLEGGRRSGLGGGGAGFRGGSPDEGVGGASSPPSTQQDSLC